MVPLTRIRCGLMILLSVLALSSRFDGPQRVGLIIVA